MAALAVHFLTRNTYIKAKGKPIERLSRDKNIPVSKFTLETNGKPRYLTEIIVYLKPKFARNPARSAIKVHYSRKTI